MNRLPLANQKNKEKKLEILVRLHLSQEYGLSREPIRGM